MTITDTKANNKGNAASPGRWVVNAKGPGVQGHLQLRRTFKDTLGCMRQCLKKKKRANIVNANHAISSPLVLLVSEDYNIPDSSLIKLREMTEALQPPSKAGLLRHLMVAYMSCHGTNFTRPTIMSRPIWKPASQRDPSIATTVEISCHRYQMFALEVFVCGVGWRGGHHQTLDRTFS